MKDFIILVDENDNQIGSEEKIKAHQEGNLHRAFSIFILNNKNRLLLQQRSVNKYHSGGLWTNTCCGHPRPGEKILEAAHRRLKEEMGFNCELVEVFRFKYKAAFENGLIENEIDHVFIGKHTGELHIDQSEVSAYKWVDTNFLENDIKENPKIYASWLQMCFEGVLHYLNTKP